MKHGFSLVELSIVLVILGLLTGGILAGQSLIRAAELRSVSTEQSRWVTAANSFRDKYFALPGDFRDATKFWNLQVSGSGCTSSSGVATVNAATGSCDGSGDGIIQLGNPSETGEVFQFWRQLSLAGLVEGTYSGTAGSGGSAHTVFGTNAPKSKLGNSGWGIHSFVTYNAGDANNFAAMPGIYFIFGSNYTNDFPYGASMKPEEVWNIDTKIDDGMPATGKVLPHWRSACTISSSPTDTSATYRLNDSGNVCSLLFMRQFN